MAYLSTICNLFLAYFLHSPFPKGISQKLVITFLAVILQINTTMQPHKIGQYKIHITRFSNKHHTVAIRDYVVFIKVLGTQVVVHITEKLWRNLESYFMCINYRNLKVDKCLTDQLHSAWFLC